MNNEYYIEHIEHAVDDTIGSISELYLWLSRWPKDTPFPPRVNVALMTLTEYIETTDWENIPIT